MTRTPFDQFSKQFLEELLLPYGEVEISKEIPGEAKLIDLWFNPNFDKDPADLLPSRYKTTYGKPGESLATP